MAEPKPVNRIESEFKGMMTVGGTRTRSIDFAKLIVNLTADEPGQVAARPGLRPVDAATTDRSPPIIVTAPGLVGIPLPFLPFALVSG